MAGKRRFWQLFLRQFCLLLAVSLAMVGFLYFTHSIARQATSDWIRFGVIDLVVLVAAGAATAWLRLQREDVREKRRPPV
jgi:TRAP-type C4-dicarboxylate transport system permease small subunit